MEIGGSDDDEMIVLNEHDLANVDMSELTDSDRRVLKTLTQAKKATDNRRHCYGISDQVIEFDAAQDSSALILEHLKNCTVRIYGRITHLTILHNTNCVIEVSSPPMSGCDISRCHHLQLSIGAGDRGVHTNDPRSIQCMYSANVHITMMAPFSLLLTTCMEVYYRLSISQPTFYPCPVNPFSSAVALVFYASDF